jgi:hypothetical protein
MADSAAAVSNRMQKSRMMEVNFEPAKPFIRDRSARDRLGGEAAVDFLPRGMV